MKMTRRSNRPSARQSRQTRRIRLEQLQARQLLAADLTGLGVCQPQSLETDSQAAIVGSSEPGEAPMDEQVNGEENWRGERDADQPRGPIGEEDAYVISNRAELFANVLDNDWVAGENEEPGSAELTARLDSAPHSGQIELREDGSFRYTPMSGFTGTDEFTYLANDGEMDSQPVRVTITVHEDSSADRDGDNPTGPVAVPDHFINEGGFRIVGNVTDNDYVRGENEEPGEAALTVEWLSRPEEGVFWTTEDGMFLYSPPQDFGGEVVFTYAVNDGEMTSEPAEVTLTFPGGDPLPEDPRDPDPAGGPVGVADEFSRSGHGPISGNVLANDYLSGENEEPAGGELTARVVAGPRYGKLTFHEDGSFTYTPGKDFRGSDRFTYIANDGENDSAVTEVDIEMGPANMHQRATDAALQSLFD